LGTTSRAKVSTVPCAALDRFLRLLIDGRDRVRFRAHKRNSCTDEHGDAEYIESIFHDEKESKEYDTKQRTKKQRENFKLKTRRKRKAGWTLG